MATHTDSHTCDICQMQFAVRANMKKHRLIHTDNRPHVCDVCQTGFTRYSDLQRHMVSHSGSKLFSCYQGCSGAGTRRNAVPANIFEPERRSGKYC